MPQPGELNIAESVSELADKASNSYHPVGVLVSSVSSIAGRAGPKLDGVLV